jgi:hypothetical protein
MAMIIAPMLWFYISSGLYFSSKYKKTTTAVVMNLGLALVLLLLLPIVLGLAHTSVDLSVLRDSNPLVQTAVMVGGDGWPGRDYYAINRGYDWPSGNQGLWESTAELFAWALVYFLAGSVFLWRARANLRNNIF